MYTDNAMETYLENAQEEIKQLIRDLCVIPAPSNHEEKRAQFCLDWFHANGGKDAYIDEALNVICPLGVQENNDLLVFMAHTDVVFPDTDALPLTEDTHTMYCPGITDDTANLAVMMICARYFLQNSITSKYGIVFVANSGEEGLGNLKGARAVFQKFGNRIKRFVTYDGGNLETACNQAVGSHRYRVIVRTEGGHSYGNFGNRNAIQNLASMINTLYNVKVPVAGQSKTTYNVGTITGGTSVNTIAQEAEMLYEYRSDDLNCLMKMEKMFQNVVEAYRTMGVEVDVELVGNRPCGMEIPEELNRPLMEVVNNAVMEVTGKKCTYHSGSTDANIPLSMGVPAVCVSAAVGKGAHTRSEELNLDKMLPASRLAMKIMSGLIMA